MFVRGRVDVQSGKSLVLGDGGGGDGTIYVAAGAELTQRAGVLDLERATSSGDGALGVVGGRLLLPGPGTVAPNVRVAGGECVFRARRVHLSGNVDVSNGTLAFLVDATNATLDGTFTLRGGALRFPERDSYAEPHRNFLHTSPYSRDRSRFDVHGHYTWSNGTVSGNSDVHLWAASTVSTGFVKMWARVVNHGAMLVKDGAIIADTEGYLEDRGTVEMEGPRTTYRGIVARRARREAQETLIHDWEDNMLYGKRTMVVGEDSARASSLGVT